MFQKTLLAMLIAGVGCIVLPARLAGISLTRNGRLWITTGNTSASKRPWRAYWKQCCGAMGLTRVI